MISFVILHYKNIKDTIECLKSIKKIKEKNKSIIVVDNNTLNLQEKKIIEEFTKDIICLDDNKGFATANNIGCKYAIKNYNPDFICVINNDIIINQLDFIKRIKDLYDKHKFDILGPKIITDGGNSINPFYAYSNIEEIKKQIKRTNHLKKVYQCNILACCLELGMKIKQKFRKPIIYKNGEKEKINVALHGCALIFSKQYLKKFKNIFYPDTFLYHEEEFLYFRINKYGLKSLYSPTIEVYHKEGASLDTRFNNKLFQKKVFKYTYIEDSLKKLLKLYEMKEYQSNEEKK